MTKVQPIFVPGRVVTAAIVALVLSLARPAHATITWAGGSNTVNADQTLQDSEIVVLGGTNTVQGLSGPPAGSISGGTLRLIGGGNGLRMSGGTITLNSDATSPGRILIEGDVFSFASSNTAVITSGGAAANPGTIDLGNATRLFTVASGTVPAAGPDFSIPARISNGGIEKAGPGILALNGNNAYIGGTAINAGTLILNGSTNSGVSLAANASFVNNGSVGGNVSVSGTMSGSGAIHGGLVVNNGGNVDFSSGTVTVDGAVTNNGTFILRHGAQITTGSGFVNNATLDVSTAGSVPANLTNNGTLIDSSVVATKTAAKTGTTVTLTINSYSGHSYQLQKSTTSPAGTSFTTNVGSVEQGATGNVLTFNDASAGGMLSFYRIAVDS